MLLQINLKLNYLLSHTGAEIIIFYFKKKKLFKSFPHASVIEEVSVFSLLRVLSVDFLSFHSHVLIRLFVMSEAHFCCSCVYTFQHFCSTVCFEQRRNLFRSSFFIVMIILKIFFIVSALVCLYV